MDENQNKINVFIFALHEFVKKYLLDSDEHSELSEKSGCYELSITKPSCNGELTISSDGEELTIFFDAYHIHYNLSIGGKYDPQDTKEVFKTVAEILAGESLAYVKYKGGKWVGSDLIPNNYGKYQEEVLKELRDFDYVTIKSWREKEIRMDASNLLG